MLPVATVPDDRDCPAEPVEWESPSEIRRVEEWYSFMERADLGVPIPFDPFLFSNVLAEAGDVEAFLGFDWWVCVSSLTVSEPVLFEYFEELAGVFTNLAELTITDGQLERWPDDLFGHFPNLASLVIRGNAGLVALPDSLVALERLESLLVGYNDNLVTLPAGLASIHSLRSLSLGANPRLVSLPEKLGDLNSLERLYVWDNPKLATLPDSVGGLNSLDLLYVWGNASLSALPASLGQLAGLKHLRIGNNDRLAALPDSVGELQSLVFLDIWSNPQLSQLPDSIGNLTGLQVVYFGSHHHDFLAAMANHLPNLKHLASLALPWWFVLDEPPDTFTDHPAPEQNRCSNYRYCRNDLPLPDEFKAYALRNIPASITNSAFGYYETADWGKGPVLSDPGCSKQWANEHHFEIKRDNQHNLPGEFYLGRNTGHSHIDLYLLHAGPSPTHIRNNDQTDGVQHYWSCPAPDQQE